MIGPTGITPEIQQRINHNRAERRRYRRRSTFGGPFNELHVTKNQRSVRFTAVSRVVANVWGSADLDDAEIDRLIRRLQAIRGGKRATKRARRST